MTSNDATYSWSVTLPPSDQDDPAAVAYGSLSDTKNEAIQRLSEALDEAPPGFATGIITVTPLNYVQWWQRGSERS